MLKSSEQAHLLNKMHNAIKKLTAYKGNLPDTNDPREVAAGELYLAGEVHKYASTMLKVARERAIIEGVTFDTEHSELKGKDTVLLFEGEHVIVSVTVSEGPMKFPHQAIRSELVKLGIPQKDIETVFKNSGVKNRNAHSFITLLKTEKTAPPKQQVSA